MPNQKTQIIGFYILLSIAGLIIISMWWPFWQLIALAGIIAVLFYPIHKKIKDSFRNPNLAAVVSLILVVLIVLVPLWIIGQLIFNELADVYNKYRLGQLTFSQNEFINSLPPAWQDLLQSISNDASSIVSRFTANAFTFVSQMLSNLASFFLSLFLLGFMVFFMLRDNEKIKKILIDLSPLPVDYERDLVIKLDNAVAGVVKGQFLVALVQGCVATIGFLIFGVPQAFLWGAVTVITALTPYIGTSLSIIPAVLYLFITGHTGAGIGMAIWGAVAVGTIDNIISPKLVGSKMKMHPLLVLLSVVGGIQLIGFLGFLFGPILMAVFVALLDIYRTNLKQKA